MTHFEKMLWHSNAAWSPTGYGQQTSIFTQLLAEKYQVAVSAFYGLEGAPIVWEGIPVFPGLGGDFGNDTLPEHAERFFGGNPKGGLVVTLCDVWPLDAKMISTMNVVSWVPVDHEPAPPKVVDFFLKSGAVPIAMSRFGESMLGLVDPLYVPHGVQTERLKPLGKKVARGDSFPKDAFVVGMVAANKGRPSRKAFPQALLAFAKFLETHENAYLYLHTTLDPNVAGGENLPALLEELEIPKDHIRVADQYALLHRPYTTEDMAQIYSAMDVLLNPSLGEGFGIPVIEAQSCGVPVIVTDATAMPELCGAGWMVKHHPYWTGLSSWQAIPDVDDIVDALEECYAATPVQREKLASQARSHAEKYDAQRVYKQYWLPALRVAEQRLSASKPVSVPSRLKVAS